MSTTFYVPRVGEYVQDTIGHWYRILEVQGQGWRYRVDQVYTSHNSESGATRFHSYGYRPVVMGRSEFKFSQE
jgi:hypothetical protein